MVWTVGVPSLDQLRELKKAELVKSAAKYFSRHGFLGTSLADVAKDMGLTKSAIYHYFPDKQTLLFECSKWAHETIVALDEGDDADPAKRLTKLCSAYARHVADNELSFIMFSDLNNMSPHEQKQIIALRDAFEQRIRALLAEIATAEDDDAMQTKLAGLLLLGGLNWMPKWLKPGGQMNAADVAERFVGIMLAAVRGTQSSDAEA